MTTTMATTPMIPANKVLERVSCPKDAPTLRLDTSSILVGSCPSLIESTKFWASSLLKFPWMMTSLANA